MEHHSRLLCGIATLLALCSAMHVSVPMYANVSSAVNDSSQPSLTVTGKVVDAITKETLPGVNVVVKGSTVGTMTDGNGRYALDIAGKNSVLVFSCIGFISQEVIVAGRAVVDVQLAMDTESLEETVVIGYGTQKKKDLTGSIATVSSKKMENYAAVGIGNKLQGKLAGVQITQNDGTPYGGTSIKIRGLGSFGASSSPLVVVDGMITNDGLNNLNPNDIEDVTVLKDASSAAIYGSRGANGVVIVTTKRGNYDSPVKVDVSALFTVDSFRKKIETLTAYEYASQVNDYYAAANLPLPYTEMELQSYGKGTNWLDEVSHTGFKRNYSVNITGGNKTNTYAVTMNLYKGSGLIRNTDFKRGNVKISDEIKILPTLKLGTSMNVNYSVSNNTDWGQAIDRALIYPSTVPAYDENGDYGISSHAGEPITMLQPLIAVNLWTYDQTWKKFLGDVYVDWEIIKGLTFKSSFYSEYTTWNQDHFIPSYSYGPAGLISDHKTAELYVDYNDNLNYEWDNILTYTTTIAHDHNLTAMAGYTFQDTKASNISGSRTDFLNNSKNLQVLDAGSDNIKNGGGKSEWAIQSYLGRINYDYKRKYLFSASLRVDQTSRISRSHRTGVFPGASVGWVLSEENFMRKLNALSYLKLRASYGKLGNQEIGTYPYQTTLNSSGLYYPFGSGNEGSTFLGVGPTAIGNSDLMWEQTSTYGVGLEANFFSNRLTFMADLYKRNTTDILVTVPLLATSGVDGFPYQNAGACTNKGIELTIGYNNLTSDSELKYEVSANWTYNVNKVTKIPSPIVNNFSRVEVGHPIDEWFGYIQEGIFQNQEEIDNSPTQPNAAPGDIKFKDLNKDGVIDAEDRTFIGHAVAPHNFGAYVSLNWKGFDFSASFYGQMGAKRSIDAPGFAITRGGEQTSAWMFRQRWTGEGTSDYVPRVVAGDPNDNYRRSTFWLRSTDFLRLQNVQLGYNLSNILPSKVSGTLKTCRVYVAAQNLFCINTFPGFDPEQPVNGYPIPRSIYLGLNLGF